MKYKKRIAIFALRDKSGKILLQHRDENAPVLPNYWGFFGGHIKKEETPEEAVRREAEEELQIELTDLKLFKKYDVLEENELKETFIFTSSLILPIAKLKKQQKEGDDLGFFSFSELSNLKIADYDKTILKDLFNDW